MMVVADVIDWAEGNSLSAATAWRCDPTGVQEHGMSASGSHRNLGGPESLRIKTGTGTRSIKTQARGASCSAPRERTTTRLRYRQAKATKRGGRETGSRSAQ